jgi:hypothetical protein
MSKLMLDTAAMEEDFFADSALIGIGSALPAYKLCWLINNHFSTKFIRQPELDIELKKKDNKVYYFAVYQYCVPLSGCKHLLYKVKNEKETILPEAKQLDYIWLIQNYNIEDDAATIAQLLRTLPDIQLAQQLDADKMKSLSNLLV